MTLSRSQIILFAVVASLAAAAAPVGAQQPPANPSPSAAPMAAPASTPATAPAPAPAAPPWAQGRPDEAVSANLAPVVPPPIATAPDKLPLGKLKLPKNFHIEVFASGMPQARSLRVGIGERCLSVLGCSTGSMRSPTAMASAKSKRY